MILLEVKFELSINGVTGEIADSRNVDTGAVQETRYAKRGT